MMLGNGARTLRPREPNQPEHADEASALQYGCVESESAGASFRGAQLTFLQVGVVALRQPRPRSYVFSARIGLPLLVRNERGEGWGEGHPSADTPDHLQARRPSSPQPSPPSAGGEGE